MTGSSATWRRPGAWSGRSTRSAGCVFSTIPGGWPSFVLPALIGAAERAPLDWSRLPVDGPWGHHILAYVPYSNLAFPPGSLHSRGCFQSARSLRIRREDLAEAIAAERDVAAGLPDPRPFPLGDAPPRTND